MFRLLSSLVLAAGVASSVACADSLDDLYAKRVDTQKKIDELVKARDAIDAELKARFADLQKKLTDAGVLDGKPPQPKPEEVLKKKLADAFDADKGTADQIHQLAELYRQASELANDKTVPSTAELLNRVRAAGSMIFGDDGVLKSVRLVAAAELRAAIGKSSDDPITDDERKKASEKFAQLAGILGGF